MGDFAIGAPRTLVAKTKNNQSQGQEATLSKLQHSCLVSRHRWEVGWCLRLLTTSTSKPCHIICQLGSMELDNVDDGVKAMF